VKIVITKRPFSATTKSSEDAFSKNQVSESNPANPFTSNNSLQAIAIPEQHHYKSIAYYKRIKGLDSVVEPSPNTRK
jgi:hypothetical protein